MPKRRTKTRTPHGKRARVKSGASRAERGDAGRSPHESRRSRRGRGREEECATAKGMAEGAWPKAAVAAQRRERDVCGAAVRARATLPSSGPPHGSRPTECLREERRSSQRAGEGRLRVGSARAHRSRGTPSRQHTPAHSRESFVAPGEDARPLPSWMDLRDFCSGLLSDGVMSGVGPPARRARLCAAVGAPARRMAQRGRRRGVAVHAVLRW